MTLHLTRAAERGIHPLWEKRITTPVGSSATADIAEMDVWTDLRSQLLPSGDQAGEVVLAGAWFVPIKGSTNYPFNNTNYHIPTVNKYSSGYVSAVPVCNSGLTVTNYGSGNLSAGIPIKLPLTNTLANLRVKPGDNFTFLTTHAGTPTVVFPAGYLVLDFSIPGIASGQ